MHDLYEVLYKSALVNSGISKVMVKLSLCLTKVPCHEDVHCA